MNKITINVVQGSDGPSLQIVNKSGSGRRIAGPKAWGNPNNEPWVSFEIDADELIWCIKSNQYKVKA